MRLLLGETVDLLYTAAPAAGAGLPMPVVVGTYLCDPSREIADVDGVRLRGCGTPSLQIGEQRPCPTCFALWPASDPPTPWKPESGPTIAVSPARLVASHPVVFRGAETTTIALDGAPLRIGRRATDDGIYPDVDLFALHKRTGPPSRASMPGCMGAVDALRTPA